MNKLTTSTALPTRALKLEAIADMSASFELLCLASGIEALGEMMDHDAQAICGPRHARGRFRRAHRWGKTKGKIGFHGGKVEIKHPRLRSFAGQEQTVPSWEAAVAKDRLGKWAMNQMLINVARSVSLPGRFGCLPETFRRLRGLGCRNRPPPAASWRCRQPPDAGVDGVGSLRPRFAGDPDRWHLPGRRSDPGRGARCRCKGRQASARPRRGCQELTENAATVQALIDNLVERGVDPGGAAAVHHRRREGAVQGDPPNLRTRRGDPALSDSQGSQHYGAVAQIAARFSPACIATSMGAERCRQG